LQPLSVTRGLSLHCLCCWLSRYRRRCPTAVSLLIGSPMPSEADRRRALATIRAAAASVLDDRERLDQLLRQVAAALLTDGDKLAMLRAAEVKLGRSRAVGSVARKLADPADARAVETTERSLRRLRQRNPDTCPDAAASAM
jgi:hypothetical protein